MIKIGHDAIPDFGLSSVAILPWLCRKRRKTIFTRIVRDGTRWVGCQIRYELRPAKTSHRPIAGSMLDHRLRRCDAQLNIDPAMGECIVLTGCALFVFWDRQRRPYSRFAIDMNI